MIEYQRILGIPFKKREKKSIDYPTQENLKYILVQPDTSKKKGRRDLTLMATLHDTEARVQEIIDLKAGNVRLTKLATITLKGKGNKKDVFPSWRKHEICFITVVDIRLQDLV